MNESLLCRTSPFDGSARFARRSRAEQCRCYRLALSPLERRWDYRWHSLRLCSSSRRVVLPRSSAALARLFSFSLFFCGLRSRTRRALLGYARCWRWAADRRESGCEHFLSAQIRCHCLAVSSVACARCEPRVACAEGPVAMFAEPLLLPSHGPNDDGYGRRATMPIAASSVACEQRVDGVLRSRESSGGRVLVSFGRSASGPSFDSWTSWFGLSSRLPPS